MQLYNVLVVGAQYRLGVFGFLALEELRQEVPPQQIGDYGLLDQRASMKWACDNAAAFGGSSEQMVIWGAWVDDFFSVFEAFFSIGKSF